MRDGADLPVRIRHHSDPALAQGCEVRRATGRTAFNREEHEVGRHAPGIEVLAHWLSEVTGRDDALLRGQALGQHTRTPMILRETRDRAVRVVLQCDEAGRCEHPCLAQSAAEELARARLARQMKSAEPTTTLPTGAERPLLRQNVAESASRTRSDTGRPCATAELKSRAPSM